MTTSSPSATVSVALLKSERMQSNQLLIYKEVIMTESNLSPQAIRWMDHLDQTEHYDIELIKKACLFASIYEETNTPFSLSTLTQGLAMADALVSLHSDSVAISAAIIYPAVFYHQTLLIELQAQFDKTICKIIQGALQMEVVHSIRVEKNRTTGQQNQIENLRKMMLAMVEDIRTVLLKLSERLIMLQHLGRCTPDMQQHIAQDTLDYYAPLANRLGIGHLKWQLEDWAFRYLNPAEYQKISKAFHMRKEERIRFIHQIIAELKSLLEKGGIKNIKISGRLKHIYSIYKKIHRKKIGFEHIYDTNAIRILVPTITDCYTALSLVHEKYTLITAEFDDYIAKPKLNKYQSIHTAVMINDLPVEVQIRTFEMHEKAELGIAAHWKYKENKSVHATDEQKIILLRELLDWQRNILPEEKTQLYAQAFHDRVYVFSPTGDVFDLPKGATPLDFAYLVHTEIGHRCRGAKINNVLVPLTYSLQTGDHIDIVTIKKGHPSQDWLREDFGYLKTTHAKQKVRQWMHKQHNEKNLADGTALWEKMSHHYKLKKSDIEKVVGDFNLKSVESLLIALGAGNISQTVLLHKLVPTEDKKIENDKIIASENDDHKQKTSTSNFTVQGAKHLLTQLAKCCHPIPGDEIMGYITQGRGISVHQKKCRNVIEAMQHRPEKLIDIDWDQQAQKKYRVSLTIQCEDRPGLLHDISGLTSQLNLSIVGITSQVSTKNYRAMIELTLEVTTIALLDDVMKKIRLVKGVVLVGRK